MVVLVQSTRNEGMNKQSQQTYYLDWDDVSLRCYCLSEEFSF